MGIEALTHRDDGTAIVVPESHDDWQQWLSAGRTLNWMMRAPLLDWLDLYGEERGYMSEKDGPKYDARLDFLPFIFKQGRAFEDRYLSVTARTVLGVRNFT